MPAAHFPLFARERRSRLRSLIGPDLQNWSLRSSLTDGQCLHACGTLGRSTMTDSTPSSANPETSVCKHERNNALYALDQRSSLEVWEMETVAFKFKLKLIGFPTRTTLHVDKTTQSSRQNLRAGCAACCGVSLDSHSFDVVCKTPCLKNAMFHSLVKLSEIRSFLYP